MKTASTEKIIKNPLTGITKNIKKGKNSRVKKTLVGIFFIMTEPSAFPNGAQIIKSDLTKNSHRPGGKHSRRPSIFVNIEKEKGGEVNSGWKWGIK